jgi:AcrR family transcriptional regulator
VKLNSPAAPDDATRHQLLEAAGAVFAEAGFRNATVREICRHAGANIAAVNYHFGDKEKLYAAVLHHSHGKMQERHPLLLKLEDGATPEKKLGAFVQSLLLRIFDNGSSAWHGKLMSREMIEPTAALDSLVEERIRPIFQELKKIVAELLDCPVNDERVQLCSFSVVSQCVFYHHCQPLIARLFPKQTFDPDGIARLADHITHFSLAAMKHLPESKTVKSK